MLAWQIAEGLKAKGHEVMLVAPRGSTSSCEIHETTQYEPEGQLKHWEGETLPGAGLNVPALHKVQADEELPPVKEL